jgi:hypothetical protein
VIVNATADKLPILVERLIAESRLSTFALGLALRDIDCGVGAAVVLATGGIASLPRSGRLGVAGRRSSLRL